MREFFENLGGRTASVSDKTFLRLFPEKDLIDFYFLDSVGLICTRQLRKRMSMLVNAGYVAKYEKRKVVRIGTDEFMLLRGLYVYVLTQKGLTYRDEEDAEVLVLPISEGATTSSLKKPPRKNKRSLTKPFVDEIDESTKGTTKENLGFGVTRFYNMYLRTTRKDPIKDPKTLVNSVFMLGGRVS